VTEIPYFDGDFWPNVIEETIKELDQEAKQREASENTEVSWALPCVAASTALQPY
jgi:E1A/CREB-binding protein